ncbi:16S rRNA (cytidine(1402)-2'-O)-methyltransferase [Hazenella coriacea]|uniref:Ribosomal RNA small subunit methyltransferase I n=1 Tax=Hazenella coriacea TaxID=1179467 RepID=A0A4R3L4Q3_9BACL|nr:16S rRNA (cytidine(1402)-2'-O)-methyltransferase [Hazenella coriacea]TCS94322.1 16S rRNA (cytidine1402-2'-O)-methyltransferase [Hazenella coriacea]
MKIQKSFEAKGGVLYIVGTPIGNLQDMTPRALEILTDVDVIAAEDTRHTRKLLTHFQISTPLISYHEHNEQSRGKQLIERIKQGESIALVSDAGMPAISDPGEEIVRLATQEEIPIVPIPGPNAALSALVASGIVAQPFLFLGFLPRSSKERKAELRRWQYTPATMIVYEAPHRLQKMLEDVQGVLGNRKVALAREITKKHEEWFRGTIDEAIEHVIEKGTRGEYTIVIEGGSDQDQTSLVEQAWWQSLDLVEHVDTYIEKGLDKKEAILQAAKDRSLPKREVYNHYHQA